MRHAGRYVFVVTYLIWVVSFWLIQGTFWFNGVAGEAIHYDYLAIQTVLSGRFLGGSTEPIGPQFLLFYLTAAYKIFGRSYAVLRLLGSLWGALLAWVAFRLGRRLGGDWAGVISGAVTALTGPIFLFELTMPGTALYLCFWLWALDCFADGLERVRPVPFILSGFGMGMAMMARPTLGLAGLLMGGYLLLRSVSVSRRLREAAYLLAGTLLVMLPVLTVHYVHFGSAAPTLSYGFALHLGYHDKATGRHGTDRFQDNTLEEVDFGAYRREASRRVGRELTYPEASRYWAEDALSWIASHPGRAAILTLAKLAMVWEPHEYPIDANYYFYRELGLIRITVIPFGLILACALPLLLAGKASPALLTVRLAAVGAMVGVALMVVNSRYRLPIVPLMAACAGPGLVQVAGWWRGGLVRDRLRLLVAGVLAAAVVAWPNPYSAPVWMAIDYGMAGNILANQSRYAEAIPWVERSLAIRPGQSYGWAFLGDIREQAGDLAGAVAAYESLLQVEDLSRIGVSPRMYTRLGELYARQGRHSEAIGAFEAAISANRYYRPAYQALAVALRESGEPGRAESVERELESLR